MDTLKIRLWKLDQYGRQLLLRDSKRENNKTDN
jgi:hypothetical protein